MAQAEAPASPTPRRNSIDATAFCDSPRDGSPRVRQPDASSLLLLQKVKSLAEDKRQLEERVRQLQLELEKTRENQIQNFARIETAAAQRQELLEIQTELRAALDSEHERIERRAGTLQQEISALKESEARSETRIIAFKQANAALERALTAMGQDLATAHARISELENKAVSGSEDEVARMRDCRASIEESRASTRLARLSKERDTLRVLIQKTKDSISEVSASDGQKTQLQENICALLEVVCSLLPPVPAA
eukprot:tig00021319_g20228.t1